jgi:hypothetical protein
MADRRSRQGLAAGADRLARHGVRGVHGPFNVLHQPIGISVIAWGFWAVCSLAEAYAVVYVLDRGRSQRVAPSPTG